MKIKEFTRKDNYHIIDLINERRRRKHSLIVFIIYVVKRNTAERMQLYLF